MVLLGEEEQLNWCHLVLQKSMLLKRRAMLGPDPEDDKAIRLLNRIVEWHPEANGVREHITYEPEPRHVQIVLKQLGLDQPSARGVVTPGTKEPDYQDEEPLDAREGKVFRSITMRLG